MRKVTSILIAMLLMVAMISCEKAVTEPVDELIEVSFELQHFQMDVEGNLKSTSALPGWPDIPHTPYTAGSGSLELNNICQAPNVHLMFGGIDGLLDSLTTTLVECEWRLEYFQIYTPTEGFGDIYARLYSYLAFLDIEAYNDPPPISSVNITPLNTVIPMEVIPYGYCYVFKDPNNVIDNISTTPTVPGLPKSALSFLPAAGTIIDDVYYCYTGARTVFIHTTGGGYLTVDLASYINTLPDAEKYVQIPTGLLQDIPFTCYVNVTDNPTLPSEVDVTFSVLQVWPYSEVDLAPF